MRYTFDFLVIGSGIAGLTYALKVADHGKVAIVTKTRPDQTNTRYAQGGIAAVTYDSDSFEKHIKDTLIAGCFLNDEKAVRTVVTEGPERIKELIDWGVNFDKTSEGTYDLAKEGGHSEYRILHHKDNTGFEIQRALYERIKQHPNIQMSEDYFSIDIITQHHLGMHIGKSTTNIECYGAYVLSIKTNQILTFLAKVTMIASGGVGNVYLTSTNPVSATGDGIAMVHRAKGVVDNMEFMQFHPTSLYNPKETPSFLITEALRGHGAILKTIDGKEFMHKYDKRASLAPRDIVARAIDDEMKNKGCEHVYLDATHLDTEDLKSSFPNIYSKCLEIGIDITKDLIPVVPAAHYMCGGIKINENGESTIQRLYAAGECTSSGLHGANRLASNSLLEAVVYTNRAAEHSIIQSKNYMIPSAIPDWNDDGTSHPEEMILITQHMKELKQLMSNYVGIVRSNLRLKRAIDRLEIIFRENEELYKKSVISKDICELRNSINVAFLIIKMARNRKESIGLHYTIDYPPSV